MSINSMGFDLWELDQVKSQIKALQERQDVLESQIVERLQESGRRTLTAEQNGVRVKGTLVEAERVITDGDKLKKSIGARLWGKVTKQVLDKEKLEAAVALGEVDANVVAAASEVVQNKPYIRISRGRAPRKRVRPKKR